jgi:outer membrane protein assembly factor BamB
MGPNGELLVYTLDTVNNRLMMWNSTKAIYPTGITWSPTKGATFDGLKGIEWNVSIPALPVKTGTGAGIACINEGYILAVYPDTVTGDSYVFTHVAFPSELTKDSAGNYPTSLNYLWMANRTDLYRAYLPAYFNIEDGVYADYAEDQHVMHCYSIKTGTELWKAEIVNASLWTSFSYNKVVAYGKVFLTGYDGHVRAWYIENGTLAWDTWFGNSGTETVYDTYPVHNGMTVADHKLFITNDEHSPDSVMWRGSKLWSVDTETGAVNWKTGGWLRIPVISDGILTACSGYDNQIYTFGRGPSKTTVSAPQTEVTLGQSLIISGTVTDQTKGPYCKTTDTACVSDESMGDWMDYMYCQKPIPQNATGVKLVLNVVDANGNYRTIGTTTSDASGFYSFQWTPDIVGKYTVVANFEGTNAYYGSFAEAAFAVAEPAVTPTPAPTAAPSAADLYFIPATIGVVIAIIVVGAVLALLVTKKP